MVDADPILVAGLADRYRLEDRIGSGGMATVYRADDLRHHRKVAVKVLRPELAALVGSERFLKEIEVTANLHHPHILGLIDSGAIEGRLFYVMPFVAGESLRQRLERERQLPVADAVRITRAVASALDYAHRQGVIHRDIKPENILLPDGQAMVADFGIARAVTQAVGTRLTETGLSLGTPQYMSPEQASGDPLVDGRTDIYALGATAYEMLGGAPPFTGPNAQAILSAVITSDPPPLQRLRPAVPHDVAAAIHTALEKFPADRFATAGEFAASLEQHISGDRRRVPISMGRRLPGWQLAAAAGALLATLAGGMVVGRVTGPDTPEAPAPIRRLDLLLPADAPLALTGPGPLGIWQLAIAIAPAGDRLAYIAAQDGTTRVALRPLDRDSAVVLPGTEGAYHPFFSPDGQWVGFFTGSELRKIQVSGGSPITLATVDRPSGAVWARPDEILLFQQDGFEQRWIAAAGGRDSTRLLQAQFGAPAILPGGEWAVGHLSSGQLAVLSLRDGTLLAVTRRGVMPLDSVQLDDLLVGASPKYLPTGHLVFGGDDGVLMALPFDAGTRRVLGGPVPMVSGIRIEEGFGFAQFALARDGTLIFVPGQNQLYGRVATLRPDGGFDTLPLPRGQYTQPRMSPDGTRLALHVRRPVGGWDIVILDLRSGLSQRLEVAGNYRAYPASWTPDGESLLVGLFRPIQNVFLGARLYTFATRTWEDLPALDGSYLSIAPNGQDFVYSNWRTGALFIRPLRGDTTATPIPARGWAATFSPDGRWLTWGGADGGIGLSAVPPDGAIHQVAERGQQPLWTPDGRHLIFRDGRRFFDVPFQPGSPPQMGHPRLLADGPFIRTFAWNHTMGTDGRITVLLATPGESTRALAVVTGFPRRLALPSRRP